MAFAIVGNSPLQFWGIPLCNSGEFQFAQNRCRFGCPTKVGCPPFLCYRCGTPIPLISGTLSPLLTARWIW